MNELTTKINHVVELFFSNNIKEALTVCLSLLQDYPDNYTLLNIYGLCLQADGKHANALSVFTKAVDVCPFLATAYINIANLYTLLGSNEDAYSFFKLATVAAPGDCLAHYSFATFLFATSKFEEALVYFRNAADLSPDSSKTILQNAIRLKDVNEVNYAIKYFETAFQYLPNDIENLKLFAVWLFNLKIYDKAKDVYLILVSLKPDDPNHWYNLGLVYNAQNAIAKAIECFAKAVMLKPEFIEARWNLALLQLLKGDFKEGWINYEYRQLLPDFTPYRRDFDVPVWSGQEIKDKTLLLYDEQGFGDAIQFIRFAVLAKEYCDKLIVQCLQPLVRLFASLSCISYVYTRGQALPHFDYQCSLLSLPHIFKCNTDNIPNTVPYLSSIYSASGYLRELVKQDKSILKIGLSWLGKSPNEKSCPLHLFKPLVHRDITFYNLQKYDEQNEGSKPLEGMNWVNLVDKITDFSDTAAIIEGLDLVITVCTANAHLAGALGKPVWILLQHRADWRWLEDRTDSPWYPTARLFRQSLQGQWEGVIERIQVELFKLLETKKLLD